MAPLALNVDLSLPIDPHLSGDLPTNHPHSIYDELSYLASQALASTTNQRPEMANPKLGAVKTEDLSATTTQPSDEQNNTFVPVNGSADKDPLPVSVAPKSKKRASATNNGENGMTENGNPSKKTKTAQTANPSTKTKERKKPDAILPGKGIPRTLNEASEADKLLLKMKDENKPWPEIRKAWEALTGETTGKSTLPNRLARLKANLATFAPEDDNKLLAIKKELEETFEREQRKIEETFEREKWSQIAAALEEQGGSDKFSTLQLQKRFKELEKKAAAEETNGA